MFYLKLNRGLAKEVTINELSAQVTRDLMLGTAGVATADNVRVLIVAENASENFGGEAVLPLRYFEALRARGISTWLITHARVRRELSSRMPQALDHIYFIEDSWLHRILWHLGHLLDHRLRQVSSDFLSRLITQRAQRRLAKTLVERHRITVVHQPTPVSPREPSLLTGLGAPVVFGPMNGKTDFPPAFRNREGGITRRIFPVLRALAPALNRVIAGKRHAAVMLVANERSRVALGEVREGEVFTMSENGVDLSLWQPRDGPPRISSACRFAFVGRLVDLKGVDLWLEAFQQVSGEVSAITGMVIGDGPERATLMEQARSAGILADSPHQPGKVFFAGWQKQADLARLLAEQDCLVFPSLCECGGAVILEAMAMKLPVIATDWGGPADYVDDECGILISPDRKETFVMGFRQAMRQLALDPGLRARMGEAGRRKVEGFYTWDSKIESMLTFYRRAIGSGGRIATDRLV